MPWYPGSQRTQYPFQSTSINQLNAVTMQCPIPRASRKDENIDLGIVNDRCESSRLVGMLAIVSLEHMMTGSIRVEEGRR